MRMFDFRSRLAARPEVPIMAWSAGAMVVSERIVLFHDSPPQGRGNAEMLGPGLGLFPRLPSSPTRADAYSSTTTRASPCSRVVTPRPPATPSTRRNPIRFDGARACPVLHLPVRAATAISSPRLSHELPAIQTFLSKGPPTRLRSPPSSRPDAFPIVEGRQATFVYHGPADAVNLRHWAFGLASSQPFERVAGTDLWHHTLHTA